MSGPNTIQVKGLVVEHLSAAGAFRALDCPEFVVAGGDRKSVV